MTLKSLAIVRWCRAVSSLRLRALEALSALGLKKSENFIRLSHLPLRVAVENFLSSRVKLKAKRRVDESQLAAGQLVQKSAGYFFQAAESGAIVNAARLLSNRKGVVCRSRGARFLTLRNSSHTAGWDVIELENSAIFLQLERSNEQLLESYTLDKKLVGWNRSHIVYRELVPWGSWYPNEGVVLFGSYMNQWGHFVIDLAFRLIDTINPDEHHNIFIQEDTPKNARKIIEMFAPKSTFWEVPVGKSIKLDHSIVPLSRTLCPVGWRPSLDPHAGGWGWAVDSPAVGQLPKVDWSRETHCCKDKLVYLARSSANVSVANSAEFEEFLQSRGFEFVRLEDYNLKGMAQLVSEAKLVVATPGSHLLNFLFLDFSTNILKVTHPLDVAFGATAALEVAGHKCTSLICDWAVDFPGTPYEKKQSPILVNLDQLDAVISILAGPRPDLIHSFNSREGQFPRAKQ